MQTEPVKRIFTRDSAHKRNRKLTSALLGCTALIAATIVAGNAAAQAPPPPITLDLKLVVKEGDPAPGTTGTFDLGFFVNGSLAPKIDNSGQVFFFAASTETDQFGSPLEGIWKVGSGAPSLLASEGKILPAFTPTTAECIGVAPTCGQLFNLSGVFSVTPGGKVLLRTSREDAAGTLAILAGTANGNLAPILTLDQGPSFDNGGRIPLATADFLLVGNFRGSKPFGEPDGGLTDFVTPFIGGAAPFVLDPVTITDIEATSRPIANQGPFSINNNADLLFKANLSDSSKVLFFDPSATGVTTKLLARTGEATPGIAIGEFTDLLNAHVNDAQQGLFVGQWQDPNGPTGNLNLPRDAIWRFDASGVPVLVASERRNLTDPVFVTSEGPRTGFQGVNFGFLQPLIAANGDIYFIAKSIQIDQNGVGIGVEAVGLWRAPAGGGPLELVYKQRVDANNPGTILPDGSEVTGFGQLLFGLSPEGALILDLLTQKPGEASVHGLYAEDSTGVLHSVIQVGQVIEVSPGVNRTVSNFSFNQDISVSGTTAAFRNEKIAINVLFTDSSIAIFRASFSGGVMTLTDFTWSGDCGDTNWHSACANSNWNNGDDGFPAEKSPGDEMGTEDVTIAEADVVISDRAVHINSLSATGSLTVNQALTLEGLSSIEDLTLNANLTANAALSLIGANNVWTDGILGGDGTVTVAPGATLTLQPAGSELILATSLVAGGTIVHTDGILRLQTVASPGGFADGAIFIDSGGTYRILNGSIVDETLGGSSISNSGTFAKETASDVLISVPFTNQVGGKVTVADGSLTFDRDFTDIGGAWEVAGGSLVFDGITTTISGDTNSSGDGTVRVSGGNLVIQNGVTLTANMSEATGGFEINDDAMVTGGGTLLNTGRMVFNSGTIETMLENDGTLVIAGDATEMRTLKDGQLINRSFARLEQNLTLDFTPGRTDAIFNDEGTFELMGPVTLTGSGFGIGFENGANATLRKTGAGEAVFDNVEFRSKGLVEVNEGILRFKAETVFLDNPAIGGITGVSIATDAELIFDNIMTSVEDDLTFTGDGTVRLSGGDFIIGLDKMARVQMGADAPGFIIENDARILGDGTFNNFLGKTTFRSGAIGAIFINEAELIIDGPAGALREISEGPLINLSLVTQRQNLSLNAGTTGLNLIENNGIYKLEGAVNITGSGPFRSGFNNSGAISGVAPQGTLQKTGAGEAVFENVNFLNNGSVNVEQGTLKFAGDTTWFSEFPNIDHAISILTGATLRLDRPSTPGDQGNHDFKSGINITAGGTLIVGNTTLNLATTTFGSLDILGSILELEQGATIVGDGTAENIININAGGILKFSPGASTNIIELLIGGVSVKSDAEVRHFGGVEVKFTRPGDMPVFINNGTYEFRGTSAMALLEVNEFFNFGELRVTHGGVAEIAGQFAAANLEENGKVVVGNQSTLKIDNNSSLITNGILLNGIWEILADSRIEIGGGSAPAISKINEFAEVSIFGDPGAIFDGRLNNLPNVNGDFTNNGKLNLIGSVFTTTGNFINGESGDFRLDNGRLTTSGQSGFENNGFLLGNGFIDGSTVNNGVISPGESPGFITINGDYTQTSTGILEIELGGLVAGTEFDQLIVNGTATLDLGALINITLLDLDGDGEVFEPRTGDEFNFLLADDIVLPAGADLADFITFTGLPGGLSFDFEINLVNGMSVFTLLANFGLDPDFLATLPVQLQSTGAYVNGLLLGNQTLSTATENALSDIAGMTEAEIPAALGQLHPEAYASAPVSFASATAHAVAYAFSDRLDHGANLAPGRGLELWAQVIGSFGDNDGSALRGLSGFDTNLYGLVTGFDAAVGKKARLGALIGYADGNQDFDSLAVDNDYSSVFFGGYGSYQQGALTLGALASYAIGEVDTRRIINTGTLSGTQRSEFDLDTITLHGEARYAVYRVEGTMIEPTVSLTYMDIDRQGAEEAGLDGLNLMIDGLTTEALILDLGSRFSRQWTGGDIQWLAELSGGWRYDLIDDPRFATGRIAGAGTASLTAIGAPNSRSEGRVSGGLRASWDNGLSLFATYDGAFGSNSRTHSARIGVGWRF